MRTNDEIWKDIFLNKSLGRPVSKLYVELKYGVLKGVFVLCACLGIALGGISILCKLLYWPEYYFAFGIVATPILLMSGFGYLVVKMLEKKVSLWIFLFIFVSGFILTVVGIIFIFDYFVMLSTGPGGTVFGH